MNRLNYEILEGIDAINDAELESGMKVLESVIHAYEKADMILENASESADLSSYDIFQESVLFQEADDATETKAEDKSEDDKANTGFRRINKKTGKKENILKSILLAIPRAIMMFVKWLKKKFTKKKENDTNKAIDNVEKAVESGELEKHADVIMEELSTTPAEKAEVKKAVSKKNNKKSKKSDAQSGMDSIEAPKNAVPEKKNDSSTKPAAPSMDDVSVATRTPENIIADFKQSDDPAKRAIFEVEYLTATGKLLIDGDFKIINELFDTSIEVINAMGTLAMLLAEVEDAESEQFAKIIKEESSSVIQAIDKMNQISNKKKELTSEVTIDEFKSVYRKCLSTAKLTMSACGDLHEAFVHTLVLKDLQSDTVDVIKKLKNGLLKATSINQMAWHTLDGVVNNLELINQAIDSVKYETIHRMARNSDIQKRHLDWMDTVAMKSVGASAVPEEMMNLYEKQDEAYNKAIEFNRKYKSKLTPEEYRHKASEEFDDYKKYTKSGHLK